MEEAIQELVEASDPANLALLAVVWWRLDRRLRTLRSKIPDAQNPSEAR